MIEILMHNWAWLVMVPVVLGVLWTAAVLLKYVRLMLNIFRDNPPPLLMGPFDFERVEGRQVWFRSFDGTRLRGMFLGRDDLERTQRDAKQVDRETLAAARVRGGRLVRPDTQGVIIFCHEYGSDMYSCTRYCRELLEAGYDLFTFDFRGQGKSATSPGFVSRIWATDKECEDVLGALLLVRDTLTREGVEVPVGLFGISRGAGAAAAAAAAARAFGLEPAALVGDGMFSTDLTLEMMMKKWVHIFARVRFVYENHRPWFWRFLRWVTLLVGAKRLGCRFPSVRKCLRRLGGMPVFLIHGQKDSHIKSAHAKRLYAEAEEPKYLWVVAQAKHNQSVVVAREEYGRRSRVFFERSFGQGQGEDVELFAGLTGTDLPEEREAEHGKDEACRGVLARDRLGGTSVGGTAISDVREAAGSLPARAEQVAGEHSAPASGK